MSTPEGRVKAAVKRELDRYPHYREMPVPSGYGLSGVDFVVCMYGLYIAIETKAPGKRPTNRQLARLRDIERCGGIALVIDSVDTAKTFLRVLLAKISNLMSCAARPYEYTGAMSPDYTPLNEEANEPRPRKRKT